MCGVVILALPVATQIAGPLAVAKQGSFFVGGREIHSDTLSSLPAREPTGTITVGQMYVRYPGVFDYKYLAADNEGAALHVWGMLFWDRIMIFVGHYPPAASREPAA